MKTTPTFAFFAASLTLAICFAPTAQAAAPVTFDWATIGDVGNAAGPFNVGAVDYSYKISKTEVTNAQYVEFLNSVATGTDPFALYNLNMGSGTPSVVRRPTVLTPSEWTQ